MDVSLWSFVWVVVGGIITIVIFIIKNSFSAGKEMSNMVTKDEVDTKLNLLKSEFDRKIDEVDTRLEYKFNSIESTLKTISDSLIKQETREIERFKYEKETKEMSKQSIDRICTMIFELNKKQEDLGKVVSTHDGIINNRRQSNNSISFES
jgi:hypothetical protein